MAADPAVKLRERLLAAERWARSTAVVACLSVCASLALALYLAHPALGASHGRSTSRSRPAVPSPARASTPGGPGALSPTAVSHSSVSTAPSSPTLSSLPSAPATASPTAAMAGRSAVGSPAARPVLSARAAILVEESTGQVLYAANANAELPMASTTKLMTALLTLEHVQRLSTMFRAPDYYAAQSDSQIGLVPGERMSVHDLLLALLIPSADDAAEDLAYNLGGRSVARFVAMMNARARELGLTRTHYSTPSGLDTAGNYSSPTDLVKLSVYLLEHYPWFKHVVGVQHAALHSGNHPRYITSTDTLLSRVPWINGVKTGHTADAGYVLVGSGTRGGRTLVSAVMGTDSEASRDANTLGLLRYGFENFRLARPVVSGSVVARPTVSESPGVRVDVLADGGVAETVARTARLTTRVEVPHQLAGPKRDHAVVGSVVVSDGGQVLARVPAELSRALPAVSELTILARFLSRPTTLLVLVLLIGGACVLGWRRRGGRRPQPTMQDVLPVLPDAVAPDGVAPEPAAPVPAPTPEPSAAQERAGAPDWAAAAESAAAAERAAAVERERRRAEREARRRAAAAERAAAERASSSARDRA